MNQSQAILTLLMEIEGEMRRIGLWSEQMPQPEALMSQQPFCVDTLAFDDWVQWILLPRLEQLVVEQRPLPANSLIAPMAEEAFGQLAEPTDQLLVLIEQLDVTLNAGD